MDHRIPSVARGEQDFQAWPSTGEPPRASLAPLTSGMTTSVNSKTISGMGFQRPAEPLRRYPLQAPDSQARSRHRPLKATYRRLVLDDQKRLHGYRRAASRSLHLAFRHRKARPCNRGR